MASTLGPPNYMGHRTAYFQNLLTCASQEVLRIAAPQTTWGSQRVGAPGYSKFFIGWCHFVCSSVWRKLCSRSGATTSRVLGREYRTLHCGLGDIREFRIEGPKARGPSKNRGSPLRVRITQTPSIRKLLAAYIEAYFLLHCYPYLESVLK